MNRDFSVGFYLEKTMKVNLSVYDLSGRLVKTFLDDNRSAGDHIVPFRLDDQWAAGTYIFKLTGDNLRTTQKIVIMNRGLSLLTPSCCHDGLSCFTN
jgi:hypothetical protein